MISTRTQNTVEASPIEIGEVAASAQRVEEFLRDRFSTRATGLGSLIASVKGELPDEMPRKLFRISKQRNLVIHKRRSLGDEGLDGYLQQSESALVDLQSFVEASAYYAGRERFFKWVTDCPASLDCDARNKVLRTVRRFVDHGQ